jgi:hypothetical protein
MNTYKIFLMIMVAGIILSCENGGKDKDEEPPVINMDNPQAFPTSCDTLYRGETFTFRATFTDNVELGGYSLDIHHNFDHHNPHTGQVGECPIEETEIDNPYVLKRDFEIPQGLTTYQAIREIEVPDDVDTGDYHFMVQLTDQTGWEVNYAVSIKIKER